MFLRLALNFVRFLSPLARRGCTLRWATSITELGTILYSVAGARACYTIHIAHVVSRHGILGRSLQPFALVECLMIQGIWHNARFYGGVEVRPYLETICETSVCGEALCAEPEVGAGEVP